MIPDSHGKKSDLPLYHRNLQPKRRVLKRFFTLVALLVTVGMLAVYLLTGRKGATLANLAVYTVTAEGVRRGGVGTALPVVPATLPLGRELTEAEAEAAYLSSVSFYDLNQFQGTTHGMNAGEVVLFCMPLRNAEAILPMMFKHLMNLTYLHGLIDLAFLVSDCSDGDQTMEALFDYATHLQRGTLLEKLQKEEETAKAANFKDPKDAYLSYMDPDYVERVQSAFQPPYHSEFHKPFRSIQIFHKDFGQVIGQGFSDRHDVKVQGIRRKLMARARNWLVYSALQPDHLWVYWRDVDIESCPGDVIQHLMRYNYDVVVPNVWRPLPEFLGNEQPYDLNSWIESEPALELALTLHEDDVIVEGYAEYPTWRAHLAYIRNKDGNPDELIDLDGVGGVSILAKAKVFREGGMFPAFTFDNHAETEAFGKLAKKMGFKVGGLPHYTLWHIYEPSEDDLKEIARKEKKKRRQQAKGA